MALNPALLAQQLETAVGTPPTDPAGAAAWLALANALILHIQTNATIVVTGTATGAMAGAAVLPVVGTATIT